MTRSLTLFASILVASFATFTAYAVAQQANGAAPTTVVPGKPLPPAWTPPSFDVQTAPPEALWTTDAAPSAVASPHVVPRGEENWAADTSAEGSQSDASH